MKKVKIGLIAVALLGAVGAFATSKVSSDTPCTFSSLHDRVIEGCQDNNPNLCCTDDNGAQYFGDYQP